MTMWGPAAGRFGGTVFVPGQSATGLPVPHVSTASATVDPSGLFVAILGTPGSGVAWHVTRMVLQGPAAVAVVTVGDRRSPSAIADATAHGSFDVGEFVQPIIVPSGNELAVVWQGVTDASTPGTVRAEYMEVQS